MLHVVHDLHPCGAYPVQQSCNAFLLVQAAAFAPLPGKGQDESSSRATTPALAGQFSGPRPPSSQQAQEVGSTGTPRISPLPGVISNASRLDALEQKLAGVCEYVSAWLVG